MQYESGLKLVAGQGVSSASKKKVCTLWREEVEEEDEEEETRKRKEQVKEVSFPESSDNCVGCAHCFGFATNPRCR